MGAAKGRTFFGLIPTGYDKSSGFGHWIYAVGYHDGSIKVGITCRPRERVVTHCRLAGGSVTWAHAFPRLRCFRPDLVERDAINRLCAIAQPIKGKETFRLDRALVFNCVRAAYAAKA